MQALKVDETATWMSISLSCIVAFIKRLIISGGTDKVCIVFYGTVSTSPVWYKLSGSTDKVSVMLYARCAELLRLPYCSKNAYRLACTCSLPQLSITDADLMHVARPASGTLCWHMRRQTCVLPGAEQNQK